MGGLISSFSPEGPKPLFLNQLGMGFKEVAPIVEVPYLTRMADRGLLGAHEKCKIQNRFFGIFGNDPPNVLSK